MKYLTGIKADCEDGVYVTGFMGSNKGFVRKYSSNGGEVWTKADFLDQISEVVYDPREDVLIVTLSTENIMKITNQGQVVKTINLKVISILPFKFLYSWTNNRPGKLLLETRGTSRSTLWTVNTGSVT